MGIHFSSRSILMHVGTLSDTATRNRVINPTITATELRNHILLTLGRIHMIEAYPEHTPITNLKQLHDIILVYERQSTDIFVPATHQINPFIYVVECPNWNCIKTRK